MNEAPLLIAALVILAIWGTYLFPTIFGKRRSAPLNSTEEFDRWTHVMADVQNRTYAASSAATRGSVRARRRKVLGLMVGVAIVTLAVSFVTGSVWWLVVHLAVDALIAAYVGLLLQVKQQHATRVADKHVASRPHDADEPPIRIVANS